MKLLVTKNFIILIYILLALIAIFDTVIPEESSFRFIAIYTQAIVLSIFLIYIFKSYSSKFKYKNSFHHGLLAFLFMLFFYGIFSSKVSTLPVLIYGLSGYFLFYYGALINAINFKHIQLLSVILLIIYSYQTYQGIVFRTSNLENFFMEADNTGYRAMYLMLLLAFNLKDFKSIVLFSFAFLLILVSLKRGAILIGSLIYIRAIMPILMGEIHFNKNSRQKILIGAFLILSLVFYVILENWDLIIYRFLTDSTGSGRSVFYYNIFMGWKNANFFHQFFGFGFFAVPQYLQKVIGGAYFAHSDWLELLYDHGLLGISLYIILIISLIEKRKLVKKYLRNHIHLIDMIIIIWLMKSIYSGVYINKDSIVLFICIGIIFGTMQLNKINKNRINDEGHLFTN